LDVDVDALTTALDMLSDSDLRRVAVGLRDHTDSAAGELDAWRATIDIDRTLRARRRTRDAAHAAARASHAVQVAAAAHGISLPDADVTIVARAAAEVARALVAGADVSADVRHLVTDWEHLVAS
jgi:hypothetical protein